MGRQSEKLVLTVAMVVAGLPCCWCLHLPVGDEVSLPLLLAASRFLFLAKGADGDTPTSSKGAVSSSLPHG